MKTAIAIAAHPDDIEFMMAGTLLLLKRKGFEIHYLNLSSGNVGSTEYDSEKTKMIRLAEAKKAAEILGAQFHDPFCNDLEIFYDTPTLRKLCAIIRKVKPSVILTHSPVDYMEDHTNTCRLAVSAAFARAAPNYITEPETKAENFNCTVYHALPHALRDPLRKRISAGSFVNTSSVHDVKYEALKAHQSQQSWLDISQNFNSYLQTMNDISRQVGKMSGKFSHSEGWRRHLHLGFCGPNDDPLAILGDDYLIDEEYEESLE